MFVCEKRGPVVIVSGVWPPIPIDEWQLTMDPRKVEEFRKKWKHLRAKVSWATPLWMRVIGHPLPTKSQ